MISSARCRWQAAVAVLLCAWEGVTHAAASGGGADQVLASYAFAPELGSGIYEINGRALQIYRLPFAFDEDGWRLTMPVTVGLLDFRSNEVIDLSLPRGIGSVSALPGLEKDLQAGPDWRITPFIRAGYTWASSQGVDAILYGVGARSTLRLPAQSQPYDPDQPQSANLILFNEAKLAIADLRGPLPSDRFLRLRTALQGDIGSPARIDAHTLRLQPYVILDAYVEPPTSPVTGLPADRYQREIGLLLSLQPRPQLLGVHLPAIGLSYRIAGPLSGWRLAFGAPF